MSATTTPKKKKTAPAKKPGDKFEKFRTRALETTGLGAKQSLVTRDPYVLGDEYGFTPALELAPPTFADRLVLADASEKGDFMDVLRVVFKQSLGRVITAIDKWERETGQAGELILTGIAVDYIEHFYGKGAFDGNFPSVFG